MLYQTGRFDYVRYDAIAVAEQDEFKKQFEELEALAKLKLRDGRSRSLFLTALEEAYMWCGKSIRDAQILRSFKNEFEHDPECSHE